jgi:putative ABC transport system permease protein
MAIIFYELALYLLPKSFRHEYGAEMKADFTQQWRRSDNLIARVLLCLETLPDIIMTALREHGALLHQDLRFALRAFRRSPGYPLIAILTIALGVGANSAIFTVVDHALVRPLPYQDPEALVKLWESAPLRGYSEVEPTWPNFEDWRQANVTFTEMVAYTPIALNLTGEVRPERLNGCQTTSSLFSLLGVAPSVGRALLPEEDNPEAPMVAILSHGLWQRSFGGEQSVLGRELILDGRPHQVVGVMPPSFRFPSAEVEFWVPIRMSPSGAEDRENHVLEVLARLRNGVTVEQAQAAMDVIARQLAESYPDTNEGSTVIVRPLREEIPRQSRLALLLLCCASAGVLLIGCANLANLLLARITDRRRELAVRTVLGAGRERLVRQILTENSLLAVAGGVLGVLTAVAMLPVLEHLVPARLPIGSALSLDARILGFTLLLSLLTGWLFAIYPAWQLSKEASVSALKEGAREGIGGRKARVRNALVVAEVATSVMLLIGAGLLVRALVRVSSLDPGFRTEGVLTLRTSLPIPKYFPVAERERFYDAVLERVRALPGVHSAGYTGFLPFVMRGVIWPVGVDGDPRAGEPPVPQSLFRMVTEGYLKAIGVPVLEGRGFDSRDTLETRKMAVVSESFARRFWDDENPINKRFRFQLPWMEVPYTVAGVVPDIKSRGLERTVIPQVYVLHRQIEEGMYFHAPKDLAVHAEGDVRGLIPALRRIIWDVDPEQPISDVRTMAELFAGETANRRHQLQLLGTFAGLAFLMATLGIYGVLSFLVSQRRQEIGVRMALGAKTANILSLILGQGLVLSMLGLGIGLLGGYLLGTTMGHLLFGVRPADPLVLGSSALACLAASLLACSVPAWRATRVDPLEVVRGD